MHSTQDRIRELFEKYPNVRFTTREIWRLLGKQVELNTIRVTLSKLKRIDYQYKNKPRLDLVDFSQRLNHPRWGLRGAKLDLDEARKLNYNEIQNF